MDVDDSSVVKSVSHSRSMSPCQEFQTTTAGKDFSYNNVIQKLKSTTSECNSVLAEVATTRNCLESLTSQLEVIEAQAQSMEKINYSLEHELSKTVKGYNSLAKEAASLVEENQHLKDWMVDVYASKVADKAVTSSSYDLLYRQHKTSTDKMAAEWKTKVADLEKHVAALNLTKAKNESLCRDLSAAKQSQQDLAGGFKNFRDEMGGLFTELSEGARARSLEYTKAIQKKDKRIQALKKKLTDLMSQSEEDKTTIDSLRDELVLAEAETERADEYLKMVEDKDIEIEDYEEKLAVLTQQVKDLELSSEKANSEKTKLKKRVAELTSSLGQLQEKVSGKDTQMEELTLKMNQAQAKLKQSMDAASEVGQLKAQLLKRDEQMAALEKKVEDLEQEYESQIEATRSSETKISEKFQKTLSQREEEILKLTEDLRSVEEKEIARYKGDIGSLKTKLEKKEIIHVQLQEEVRTLMQDLSKKEQTLAGYEKHAQEFAEMSKASLTLIEQVETQKKLIQEQKQVIKTLKADSRESGTLQIQLDQAQSSIAKVAECLKEKEAAIKKLNVLLAEKSKDIDKKESSLSLSQKELSEKTEHIKQLRTSLESTKMDLKESKLAQKKVQGELDAIMQNWNASKLQHQTSETELHQVKDTLKHSSKESDLLRAENAKLSTTYHERETTLLAMREEVQEQLRVINELQGIVTFKNTIIEEQENELYINRQLVEESQKASRNLNRAIQSLAEEKSALLKEKEKTELTLQVTRDKLELYIKEEQLCISEVASLKKERNALQEKMESNAQFEEKAEKTIHSLTTSVENYQQEVELLAVKTEELKKINRKCKSENESLERTLGESMRREDELKASSTATEELMALKIKELQCLKTRISEIESQSESARIQFESRLVEEQENRRVIENDFCDLTLKKEALEVAKRSVETEVECLKIGTDNLQQQLNEELLNAEKLKKDMDTLSSKYAEAIKKAEPFEIIHGQYSQVLKDHELFNDHLTEIIKKLERAPDRNLNLIMSQYDLLLVKFRDLQKANEELLMESQSKPAFTETQAAFIKSPEAIVSPAEDTISNDVFAEHGTHSQLEDNQTRVTKPRSSTAGSKFKKTFKGWNLDSLFARPLTRGGNEQSQATLNGDVGGETQRSDSPIEVKGNVRNFPDEEQLDRARLLELEFKRILDSVMDEEGRLEMEIIQKADPKDLSDRVIDLTRGMYRQMLQQRIELEERDEFVKQQALRLEALRGQGSLLGFTGFAGRCNEGEIDQF